MILYTILNYDRNIYFEKHSNEMLRFYGDFRTSFQGTMTKGEKLTMVKKFRDSQKKNFNNYRLKLST